PAKALVPPLQLARAKGWGDGEKPAAANGLAVNALATGLSHPRWLYVRPNGDVLVAESDGPPRPDDAKGIKGFIYHTVQKRAGAGGTGGAHPTPVAGAVGGGARARTIRLAGRKVPDCVGLVRTPL